YRHTGRVVAAVLQPVQPLDQDRRRLPPPHVSDDAAHGQRSFASTGGGRSTPSRPARPKRLSCASFRTRRAARSSGPSTAPQRAHETPVTAPTSGAPRSGVPVSDWMALHCRHSIVSYPSSRLGPSFRAPLGWSVAVTRR